MKFLLRLPLVLLATLLLTDCSSDSMEEYLKVSTNLVTLVNGQGQLTVSSNTSWKVENMPDWLSCSNLSGSGDMALVLTEKEANPDTKERRGSFTVKATSSTASASVTVVQPASPEPPKAEIALSKQDVTFTAAGESVSITVTANYTWSMSSPVYKDSQTGWLTLSPAPGNSFKEGSTDIEIVAAENTSTEERTAEISFACGEATATVKVTQAAAEAVLTVNGSDKAVLSFISEEADSKMFSIESNVAWTVKSDKDWCTTDKNSGKGNETVTVSVAQNTQKDERTATVTVEGGGIKRTVEVTQAGVKPYLTATPTVVEIGAAGGSRASFAIESNTTWTVEKGGDASWLTVTPTSGTDSGTVELVAEENTVREKRSTTIIISGDGFQSVPVQVVQAGAAAFIRLDSGDAIAFKSCFADNKTFNMESNTSWTITTGSNWITVNPSAGNGSGTVTVSVTDNSTASRRESWITISAEGVAGSKKIVVSQDGVSLKVSENTLVVGRGGGNVSFSITSNAPWTISGGQDWCLPDMTFGEGNAEVTVSVSPNEGTESREATLTVKAGDATCEVTVKQEARQKPKSGDMNVPDYSRRQK